MAAVNLSLFFMQSKGGRMTENDIELRDEERTKTEVWTRVMGA